MSWWGTDKDDLSGLRTIATLKASYDAVLSVSNEVTISLNQTQRQMQNIDRVGAFHNNSLNCCSFYLIAAQL